VTADGNSGRVQHRIAQMAQSNGSTARAIRCEWISVAQPRRAHGRDRNPATCGTESETPRSVADRERFPVRYSGMSTPKKKAGAQSGKGKKGTDAGSRTRAALKMPVDKFKKESSQDRSSKTAKNKSAKK
jgi:hypothetical protein